MKATPKKIFLISILSLLSLNVFANNVAGNYQCTRTDANNVTNTYPLTITITGGTYTLQWQDANGFPTLYGTGVMAPNINSALSVVFWDAKSSDVYGNELFSIKPDGSLSSSWALQATKQVGTETCKKS
jgi:hypothetical protein